MNTFRLVVLVLVTYALGMGTGVVGGVYLSYQELSRPAAVTHAVPSSTPTLVAVNPPVVPSSTATPLIAHPTVAPSASESLTPPPVTKSPPVAHPSATDTLEPPPVASPTPEDVPTPEPTPKPHKTSLATLVVSSNKGDGYVTYVDGQNAGETPVEVEVLPNRTHKIRVNGGDKFDSWQGNVKLTPGQKRTVTAMLKSKPTPVPVTPVYTGPGPSTYHPSSHPGGSSGPPSVTGTHRF